MDDVQQPARTVRLQTLFPALVPGPAERAYFAAHRSFPPAFGAAQGRALRAAREQEGLRQLSAILAAERACRSIPEPEASEAVRLLDVAVPSSCRHSSERPGADPPTADRPTEASQAARRAVALAVGLASTRTR